MYIFVHKIDTKSEYENSMIFYIPVIKLATYIYILYFTKLEYTKNVNTYFLIYKVDDGVHFLMLLLLRLEEFRKNLPKTMYSYLNHETFHAIPEESN